MSGLLAAVRSIKVKLGLLVGVSVVVAGVLVLVGDSAGVPAWLVLPVAVALALGVTQLLAAGMVAPLRQMTTVAGRMARGDYAGRVDASTGDEVGRLAGAFNTMAADLETVDRERRDLISTVSHELRTPLTAMTAQLENLADGVVPADAEHLGSALAQADRLRDLVTDLLDLSRVQAGAAALDLASVPLRELVEECVVEVQAAGRTVPYVVDVAPDLTVTADRRRLRQVLVNALDNAGRHSPGDEKVTVLADVADAAWWLEVVDRGPGNDPADAERVFERFGPVGQGTGGGTGLGLAVARWVATLHGGTLRFLEPPDGVGARLRLEVRTPVDSPTPLGRPEEAPPQNSPEEIPMSDTLSSRPQPPATAPGGPVPQPGDGGNGMDQVFGGFWPERPGLPGRPVVAAAAGAGVLAGALMTFHGSGIGTSLTLLGAGVAAFAHARARRTPWAIGCAVLAALLVTMFTLRAAEWLGVLSMFAAAAVFLCGVTGARTLAGIVLTGLSWPLASLRGLPWVGPALRFSGRAAGVPAVVRTVLWSLLGLAVFGAIFASADALFASWVDGLVPNLTFGDLVARAFVACAVFALTLAAAYLALSPSRVDLLGERRPAPLANRFEWLVPVLVVDAVFALFLLAQAAAVFGGHDYIEETTGLTYADYVHQGFGQLTLATALMLVVVWAAARRAGDTPTDRWWLRGSLGALCLLTLVVVASALYRMHVYQEAYGFTTLRLFVDVFEGWLGLVVLAVAVAGLLGWARWLPRFALVTGALAVLGLGLLDPDAWVADHNLDRFEATGELDALYLQTLSADAAPVIADRMPAQDAACILRRLPAGPLSQEARDETLAWNLGRSRAATVVDDIDMPPARDVGTDPVCAPVWEKYARD